MKRYFTRLATGVMAASIVSTAALAQDTDAQTQIITDSTPIVIDNAASQALSDACLFYRNLLGVIDQRHFDGPTTTSHEDMAYAALQNMLSDTYAEHFFDTTTRTFDESVITYNNADETDIDTLTLGNAILDIERPAAGSLSSYEDQCHYMQNAAVTISGAVGTEIFSLYESAVNGAIHESRDPHTSYLPPVDTQAMRTSTNGSFGGLGVEVSKSPEGVLINTPMEGTPAEEAGLQAGDIIISADGQPLQALTLEEAVDLMRGPVGSDITVTIQRGDDEPFDVTITRGTIRMTAADVEALETAPTIMHVDVETFNRQTIANIIDGFNDVYGYARTAGEPIASLILDFRNNPGGLLTQAERISDLFVSAIDPSNPGPLVATGKDATQGIVFEDSFTGPQAILDNLDIVILTNRGSASASEIVAGTMQDAGFEVIGNRTFGKGSVQTVMSVTRSGSLPWILDRTPYGSVKITTEAFFPGRSGLSNQGSGIIPNVDVQYNDIRDEFDRDGMREEDLPNTLHVGPLSRAGQTSDFICSLKAEFTGALDDQQMALIPDEYEATLRIRNEQTDQIENQTFFDIDLHCAVMRLQGVDDTQYATITPTNPTPNPHP